MRRGARADLQIYLAYFGQTGEIPSGSTDAPSPSLDLLVDRLFQLHVVTRAMLPTKVTVDQHVDLVQVSADTRSALTHHSLASEKLTGLQLHHFGAFYKSAWRANDWMWGRLDGAGWLVHLLLDPLRLKVVADAAAAPSGKQQWFLDEIAARIPGLVPIGSKARRAPPTSTTTRRRGRRACRTFRCGSRRLAAGAHRNHRAARRRAGGGSQPDDT